MAVQPKVSRLKSQLAASDIRKTDNALYQVINSLIDYINQLQIATDETIAGIPGGGTVPATDLTTLDILTSANEVALLPSSRQLLAGAGISFNDAVANQRTITGLISALSSFITTIDETATLTSSRRLVAGNSITFDITAAGIFKIDGKDWSVLTDGDLIEPELIFAAGAVIMLETS